ncbi:MAG: hypothetical protein K9K67_09625 [Bacteriovoracaceae bacterium]|nr:hypothetical protein [Bacteriovoracaceae bacterium]
MAKLVFFILYLFSTSILAVSVADRDPTAPIVSLNASGSVFELYVEPNTGVADSPHQLFIPVGTTTTPNQAYSYFSNRTNLPTFTGKVPDGTVSLNFRLNIEVEGSNTELYAAVEESSTSFRIVAIQTFLANSTDQAYSLDLEDVCTAAIGCENLTKTNPPKQSVTGKKLFFFVGDDRALNSTFDPSTESNGVYYELNLSSYIYDTEFQLFDLFKGDGQLTADYRAFTMDKVRSLYGIVAKGSQGLCSGDVGGAVSTQKLGDVSLSFSNLVDLISTQTIGQKKVPNLENGFCYSVRLLFCDLYGFCSTLSKGIQNTPEDIQALLEKQACFFFTAGFGEQHPIVDYFQAWRDNTLRRSWLGRQFIEFYYRVAPQYTPFILERPWLQRFIRSIAYVLYGVIKWGWLMLFFATLAIVQFFSVKKIKKLI